MFLYMDTLRVCLLQSLDALPIFGNRPGIVSMFTATRIAAELDTGWFGSFSGNIYIC